VASLKLKGDLAELKVAADLLERGCKVSLPFGEDCDYDLIADAGVVLHRIQVKFTESNGGGHSDPLPVALADEGKGAPNEALHSGDDRLDRCVRPDHGSLLLLPRK
jgi:hypothetical protein